MNIAQISIASSMLFLALCSFYVLQPTNAVQFKNLSYNKTYRISVSCVWLSGSMFLSLQSVLSDICLTTVFIPVNGTFFWLTAI